MYVNLAYYNVHRINIYGIIINVNSSLDITSDRNEVQLLIIQQPMIRTNISKVQRVTRQRKVLIIANTNDTYEYNEGATSNQRKKGKNYNKYQ